MKNIKYLFISLVALVTVSCDKFLDIQPVGEKLEETIFEDAEGFEDALYGVYSSLTNNSLYGEMTSFYINDVIAQYIEQDYDNGTSAKLADLDYTHSYVAPSIEAIWQQMYISIGYVNNIIKNLEEQEEAKSYEYYNIYYSEALALRAFMHFELTRYFCENILLNSNAEGIPYRDNYDFEITDYDKLSVTYEKILADLSLAEEYASEDEYFEMESWAKDETYLQYRQIQMNKYAVWALMARVYWTMDDLANAKTYAEKVIRAEKFSLVDQTKLTDEFGSLVSLNETIWGLYSDDFYAATYDNLMDNSAVLETKGISEIYSANKYGVDYRLERWFTGTDYSELCKIVNQYTIDGGSMPYNYPEYVDGINMIRLPEMYYIMCEYYIEQGDQTNARLCYDAVATVRGLTSFTSLGFDVTLDILNAERKKEYIGEGQYLFVMKKYNMDITDPWTKITIPASTEAYVFEIPDGETDYR